MRKEEKKVLKFYLELINDAINFMSMLKDNTKKDKKKIIKIKNKYNVASVPGTEKFIGYFEFLEKAC